MVVDPLLVLLEASAGPSLVSRIICDDFALQHRLLASPRYATGRRQLLLELELLIFVLPRIA